MDRVRVREEWIANMPGFWDAVWAMQDRLDIPRYRGRPVERRSLPHLMWAYREEEICQREAEWSDCPVPDALPSAGEALVRASSVIVAVQEPLWQASMDIVRRFNLAENDVEFVTQCIVGEVESIIAGRYWREPVVEVIANESDPPKNNRELFRQVFRFRPGRIYLDVTESVDIEADVRDAMPAIESARLRLGIDLSQRARRRPGQPSKAVIAAYARLLKDHGPVIGDRTMTWKEVAAEVNQRLGTEYDQASLRVLVRSHRPTPPNGAPDR